MQGIVGEAIFSAIINAQLLFLLRFFWAENPNVLFMLLKQRDCIFPACIANHTLLLWGNATLTPAHPPHWFYNSQTACLHTMGTYWTSTVTHLPLHRMPKPFYEVLCILLLCENSNNHVIVILTVFTAIVVIITWTSQSDNTIGAKAS